MIPSITDTAPSVEPDYLARHLAQMPPHRALLRAVEARMIARLDLPRPLLDVGCGDGHFTQMALPGRVDVGVDPLQSDLREARQRCPAMTLAAASGTQLPFSDGSFASVISNSVIEHIPDLDGTLSEIQRVLRPGGKFVFTTPSDYFGTFLLGSTLLRRSGAPQLGLSYTRWFDGISHHYHRLSPDVWHDKLEDLGFEVRDWYYYFSRDAHKVFDLSHYLGVPFLASRKLTGRWMPVEGMLLPLVPLLRRYYNEPRPRRGAYLFFSCEKRQ